MARIRITRPIRAALLDQLQAAGLAPLTPEGTSILEPDPDGGGGWLTVPDAQQAAAQAVIDAHDASALDAAAAQERTRYQQDVANVKAFMAAANGTATNAQRDAFLKSLVRVVAQQIRELRD